MGAWYIRITSDKRKEVELNLIVQAVIALGEQLRQEAVATKELIESGTDTEKEPDTEISS